VKTASTRPLRNSTPSPCDSNFVYVKYHVGREQPWHTP
jgi:hypothetical protein